MKLDFFTLYVIILLNSVTLCVVWAGFVQVHRTIPGAGFWLASCLFTTVGGVLLAFEDSDYAHALIIAGNACVVFGFCLVWTGIRRHYGMSARWRINALIVAFGVAAMMLAGETRASQNVAYAGAQLVPLALAISTLIRHGRFSLGAIVAIGGIAVAMIGQGTEAILNLMRIAGHLLTADYYSVASYLLVAIIFGASLWNLGFLLMAIDRLRSELAELALYDDLTELPNRRHFIDAANRRLAQARRTGRGFAIFLIDVDRFKTINDTYGHAAGDACLRFFAELALRCIGDSGMIARLAGDEFGILVPDAGATSTQALADALVQATEVADFRWRQHLVPLTISIGVAEWHHDLAPTHSRLMELADAALYEAKRAGRNRYALVGDPIATINADSFAVMAE